MLDPLWAARARRLFESPKRCRRGHQHGRATILQLHIAFAACGGGFEIEPGLVRARQGRIDRERGSSDGGGLRARHRCDLVGTLDGDDGPGESEQIAPIAAFGKQARPIHGVRIAECGVEAREPFGRAAPASDSVHPPPAFYSLGAWSFYRAGAAASTL
jgi:hypothetical protein